jgi:prepilin-type processing-associated H-X9-DG protein/prepilin-type N-terminal cleavage/methylation domain-containing protein
MAPMKNTAPAFTLIELLVVIAMIAVLASLAYAGAGAMIGKGHATKCLSNMRQIGAAMQMFVGDNDGRLPSVQHKGQVSWTNSLGAFLGTNFIGRCPALQHYPDAVGVTYGWSDMLTETNKSSAWQGLRIARIARPSSTIVVAEKQMSSGNFDHFHFREALGSRGRISMPKFEKQVNIKAHGNRANYLFVDGHVETLAADEVKARLETANPAFLVP